MSLKDKTFFVTVKNTPIRWNKEFDKGADFLYSGTGLILESHFDEAIKSYWDAVKHPEKHPELVKEFSPNMVEHYLKSSQINGYNGLIDYMRIIEIEAEWMTFCFKHFIGDDE